MHYANGREVQIGDKVVGKNANGYPASGIVVDKNASESCNIAVVPVPRETYCTDKSQKFLHVDDAFPPENPTKSQ